jgi:hypothetical protein
VFENRVRRIFDSKRKEIMGEWIKLREKFHNSHVEHMAEVTKACQIFVENPEGKRPLFWFKFRGVV